MHIQLGNMRFGRFDCAAFGGFMAYAACSVIMPMVLLQAAKTLNFPLDTGGLAAGGALEIGRSLLMLAIMLSCGLLADRWGMRVVLGCSLIFLLVGIFLAACAQAYWFLFLSLMLCGLGEGVIEGLMTPFVEKLHPAESGRYMNFTHSFWSVGIVVAVLVAGALLQIGCSWRLVVGLAGLMCLPPLWLFLGRSTNIPAIENVRRKNSNVWPHTVAILKTPRFWLFFAAIAVAGGGEYGLTFWTASYVQLEFQFSAWAAGLAISAFSLGMFLGRTSSGLLVKQEHLRRLILVMSVCGVLVCSGFQLLGGSLPLFRWQGMLFVLLFLAGGCSAPFWPSIQSCCASTLPHLDATMIFVLLSCSGVPACALFTWLMGAIGDRWGMNAALLTVPACYLTLALLVAVEWLTGKKQASRDGGYRHV